MSDLDPTLVVILAMSVTTYATKAGGLWLLGRIDLSDRAATALRALPGAIVVSLLVPELARAGLPGWTAAAAVLAVARRTDSVLLALAVGTGAVVSLRFLL